jgi:hypothetical protein
MRRILVPVAAFCLMLAPAAVRAANAPKPPKQPAKLTLTATPLRVTFGSSTTLAGKLTGGKNAAGQAVTVQADAYPVDGRYVDVGSTTTDANGDWHLAQAPTALTRYRAQAKTAPPATSDTADVGVRLRVTIRVSDRTPSRGERVRFHGTAGPAHDGKPVLVQRRTSTGSWRTVARTTLRDAGTDVSSYSRRVRVRRSGTYRIRALPQDGDHLRGTSHPRRLTVGG